MEIIVLSKEMIKNEMERKWQCFCGSTADTIIVSGKVTDTGGASTARV